MPVVFCTTFITHEFIPVTDIGVFIFLCLNTANKLYFRLIEKNIKPLVCVDETMNWQSESLNSHANPEHWRV